MGNYPLFLFNLSSASQGSASVKADVRSVKILNLERNLKIQYNKLLCTSRATFKVNDPHLGKAGNAMGKKV